MVYSVLGRLESPHVYLVYYPINIGYFYGCLYIHRLTFRFTKVRLIKGALIFIVLLTAYLAIKGLADFMLDEHQINERQSMVYIKGFFQRNLFRALYFTVLATFYWAAEHVSLSREEVSRAEKVKLMTEKENAELEMALAKAENAYRQQQLNPHMLFNTLNFIYTNVQRHSDDAARCVWLLSEIMRFSLEASGIDGKVVLENEASQIENLLEINHYRFPYPIFIDVDMEGNFQLFRIIPLILLTLTENVFKHGNLTEAQHPATIKLYVDDQGCLTFVTRNLKKPKSEHQRNQQIGLQNVRIRLDAEYKGNYKLEIGEPADQFELTLTLNL